MKRRESPGLSTGPVLYITPASAHGTAEIVMERMSVALTTSQGTISVEMVIDTKEIQTSPK